MSDTKMNSFNGNRNNDPFRPGYHITPPMGWMNDPNGLIYYQGRYHVFYQHNPYAPVWGPMHWGHVTSTDLVHWQQEPIAMKPDQEYDSHPTMGGCFSGSAIEYDNKLYLIYTGCVENRNPCQTQAIAFSEDGVTFTKYRDNPVIPFPPAGCSQEFRDPKIWREQDRFYCVVGSQSKENGQVLLYCSDNLYEWGYLGVMAESDGRQGNMWECPDLCVLEKHEVLLYSPIDAGDGNTRYLSGHLDYREGRLSRVQEGRIDCGANFYAPQSFTDHKNRRIMFGWLRSWEAHMPSEKYGWAGQLSIPRRIWTDDLGKLHQEPAEELKTLRTAEESYDLTAVSEIKLNPAENNRYEILLKAVGNAPSVFRLFLRCSKDRSEQTVITADTTKHLITVDRSHSGIGEKGSYSAAFAPEADGSWQIRIFIDNNSLELFTSQYGTAMSFYIWPDFNSTGIFYQAEDVSDGRITLDLWKLS